MSKWINVEKRFNEMFRDVNTFNDFQYILNKEDNQTKGDLFEYFCKLFFLHDPIRNENVKNFYLGSEIPESIIEKLNLPRDDRGIDAIIETIDGKYNAVQVKYRSDIYKNITYGETSTFQALTYGTKVSNINKGIFFTNCHDVNDDLKNDKYIHITHNIIRDSEIWTVFNSLVTNKPKPKLEPYKKLPHQESIVNAFLNHYKQKTKGKIISACGTGKTLIAYWSVIEGKYKNIMVLVPSLYLLSGIFDSWKRESIAQNIQIDFLLVGSDVYVNDDGEYEENPLQELQYELTTDITKIKEFINKQTNNIKVVICTYHSSELLINTCTELNYKFNFGLYDEAHRTCGIANKKFSRIVKADIATHKLFLTATPKIKNNKINKTKTPDPDCLSMDDIEQYGDVIYNYTIRQAINEGILCDYRIVASILNESDEALIQNLYSNVIIDDKKYTMEDLITAHMIIKIMLEYNQRHVLTMSNTNKKASKLRNALDLVIKKSTLKDKIYLSNLTGNDRMYKRRATVNEFEKSEYGIITSARIFNEGVDIKICDTVVFADQKSSTTDIIQCVGRCLRKYSAKPNKLGYILIPTIMKSNDEDEFFSKTEKGTPYKKIKQILRAIGSTDDQVQEKFIVINAKPKIEKEERITDEKVIDTKIETKIDIDKLQKDILLKVFTKTGEYTLYDEWKKLKNYVLSLKLYESKNPYVEYKILAKNDERLLMNPENKYGKYFKTWHEYFGFDINKFVRTKEEWLVICRKFGITTTKEYREKCGEKYGLSPMPGELYKDFTTIENELNIKPVNLARRY